MTQKTLQIGKLNFPNNLIQGPLAGISCAPFRRLTQLVSEPAYTCTEMISCKTLLNKSQYAQVRFLAKSADENKVSYQLAGTDPYEVGESTKIVTDRGADLVDLNCGCPVNKIRRKGAGSKLLSTPDKLEQLIKAMKQNTHVPVTVKIRIVDKFDIKANELLLRIITEAGADALIVHGRHWTEHYETPCRYEHISHLVSMSSIPIIGNGDVHDVTSLQKMLATGCAGVMIARAGVGQPHLIKNLLKGINGHTLFHPTQDEIKNWIKQHIECLMALLGQEKFAILQSRKFLKYYFRDKITGMKTALQHIYQCEDYQHLQSILKSI